MAYGGRVWSFIHNYADPIIERLSWRTDVMRHRDASEQRRQVRVYPRRILEYSILAQTPLLRSRLDNLIWSSMDASVMLPIWTDGQRLTTAATSGTATVTVSTATYDYDTNNYVILWSSPSSYEVVAIQSVGASSLTLEENLVSTWPIGTVVAPARLARISSRVDGTQIAHDVRPYKIVFEVDEASPSTNRITTLSPSQYRDVDIFTDSTEASEDLPFGYEHSREEIDFETGLVNLDAGAQDDPTLLIPYAETFQNRAEISSWLGFLDRRKGRRVPFWIPSWEKDFELTAMSSVDVTYASNGYTSLINLADGRKDFVLIYERDGVVYNKGDQIYVRGTAVVDNGDGTETLDIAIGGSTHSSDVDKVRLSYLRYCRLESDTVEIAWQTSCVARSVVRLRELLNVPT
jgi:hypothetical protein